jgi:glycosyltransferase involved in cell wall biosynthesis
MPKKVLIITYYWPPSGGAGVQRWLKFVKYLSQYGWEPVVYTVKDGEYPVLDHSLEKEVPRNIQIIRRKITEPYAWYKKFIRQNQEEKINTGFISQTNKPAWKENISRWIRGNLFIPDARKFWIRPSVRFLLKYLQHNPVQAIISTGPPHSMHLIALGLKSKLNIPWIADFRDPWTNIDFYKDLHLTRWADKRHHKLEKKVLTQAGLITTVSWSWAHEFQKLGARNVEVITNGYDPEDFKGPEIDPEENFVITHIGSMNKDRNPVTFWKVLAEICLNSEEFRKKLLIRLIGDVDISVWDTIDTLHLNMNVEHIEYVMHSEVNHYLKRSQILLLPLNNTPNVSGIIPGKIFEYLAAHRFILVIGSPEGDSSQIINETRAGKVIGFDDYKGLKAMIHVLYQEYKNDKLSVNTGDVSKYSRKKLTGKVVELLNRITPL